jgi:hypothetical protein
MLKNLLLVSILLSSACSAKMFSGNAGIIGEVRWVEGNLMPAVNDTTYAQRAKGIPARREIYIYKALSIESAESADGVFYPIFENGLVKKIKTKKDGTFKVNLPAGVYSLFVLENHQLFANRFDGEGLINPVKVREHEWTEISILVNYNAYY